MISIIPVTAAPSAEPVANDDAATPDTNADAHHKAEAAAALIQAAQQTLNTQLAAAKAAAKGIADKEAKGGFDTTV